MYKNLFTLFTIQNVEENGYSKILKNVMLLCYNLLYFLEGTTGRSRGESYETGSDVG